MDYFQFFTTDNKSGWKCRENKLKRNCPELYDEILMFTNQYESLQSLLFVQRVYHFIFKLTDIPTCPECDKTPPFFDIRRGYQKFCSIQCSNKNKEKQELTKQTNLKIYGAVTPMLNHEIKEEIEKKNTINFGNKNPFGSKTIQDKIRITNKRIYNNEVPSKTDQCKEKYKRTCNREYGHDSHWQNKEFKEKVRNIIHEKYGVDNVFQNPDTKNKIKDTNIKNLGVDNPAKSKDVYDKIKKTNFSRHGSECVLSLERVKEKIRQTNFKNYGTDNIFKSPKFRRKFLNTTSKIELLVGKKIGGISKFDYHGKEYDIIKDNDIFEIDGDFFHPSSLSNLTITQVGTLINDKEKIDIINQYNEYNLYKIHVSDIPSEFTVDDLKQLSYIPDYTLDSFNVIISKEYFINYIQNKGKKKLQKYVNLLLKFVRTFHPEFPYQVYNESFDGLELKINKYNTDSIYNTESKTFSNNSSRLGCGYLKNNFQSFWHSKFSGNYSPVEMWYDDDIMRRVIAYRIGVNNSGETFNFSIKELIKGISAIRGTISFFKPIVASAIYDHYLINHDNPVVFDPCGGFGGRMLGFKSKYPNGTYIGIEPNIETYNELINLSSNFTNVQMFNCKLEEFNEKIEYDLAFTSIPYFDLEEYSNNTSYDSFDDWKNTFITKLLSYPRLLVNMTESLAEELGLTQYIDAYLSNQVSHFDKQRTNKKEVIVKLNF